MKSFTGSTITDRIASGMAILSRTAMSLSVAVLAVGTAHAAVVGEVIATYDASIGREAVMSASTGSGFTSLACGSGDLSYNGGTRYFVGTIPTAAFLPDGYHTSALVAFDEDCTQTVTIFSSPSMRFSTMPHWAHDGTRLAVYGESWDLVGSAMVESGIYVASVTRDGAGRPIGIADLHLVIAAPGEMLISWSGDDQRIAYVASAPDGGGGLQNDIWVVNRRAILTRRRCGRFLGLLEGVVHVFIRRSTSGCEALHQAG